MISELENINCDAFESRNEMTPRQEAVLNVITHMMWKSRSFKISYFVKGLKSFRDVFFILKLINEQDQLSEKMKDTPVNEMKFYLSKSKFERGWIW